MVAIRETYGRGTNNAQSLAQQARSIAERIPAVVRFEDKVDQVRANPYILTERVPALSRLVAPAPFFIDHTPIEPVILEGVRDLKTQILAHDPKTPLYLNPTEIRGIFGIGYTTIQLDTFLDERIQRRERGKTLAYSRFGTNDLPLQIGSWTRTSKVTPGSYRTFESRAVSSFGESYWDHRVSTTYNESGPANATQFEGIEVKDIFGRYTGIVASVRRLHNDLEGFLEVSYESWKMGVGRDAPKHEWVAILMDAHGNVFSRETRNGKGDVLTHDNFVLPPGITAVKSAPQQSGVSESRVPVAVSVSDSQDTDRSSQPITSQPHEGARTFGAPKTPIFLEDGPITDPGATPILGTSQEFLLKSPTPPQRAKHRHPLAPYSQWTESADAHDSGRPTRSPATAVPIDRSGQFPAQPKDYTTRVLVAESSVRGKPTRPLPPLNQIPTVRTTVPLPDLPDLDAVPLTPALEYAAVSGASYSAPYYAPQPQITQHFYGNQELGNVAFWPDTPTQPRHPSQSSGRSMTLKAVRPLESEPTESRQTGGGGRQRVHAVPLGSQSLNLSTTGHSTERHRAKPREKRGTLADMSYPPRSNGRR